MSGSSEVTRRKKASEPEPSTSSKDEDAPQSGGSPSKKKIKKDAAEYVNVFYLLVLTSNCNATYLSV